MLTAKQERQNKELRSFLIDSKVTLKLGPWAVEKDYIIGKTINEVMDFLNVSIATAKRRLTSAECISSKGSWDFEGDNKYRYLPVDFKGSDQV